ncbi:MAG: tetratricopeptide repeat protein [Anaerolineae bacterium]|nr:tetratricopeptide repeat protein [Anaerolineae bacterium]
MSNSTTVYLSYWHADLGWAMQIRRHLIIQGYRVFCDARHVLFKNEVLADFVPHAIAASSHFLMLLTPDYFMRCTGNKHSFFLRAELEIALHLKRALLPITFTWFRLEYMLANFRKEGLSLDAVRPVEINYVSFPMTMNRMIEERLKPPQKVSITPIPTEAKMAIDAANAKLDALPLISPTRLHAEEYYESGYQNQFMNADIFTQKATNQNAVQFYSWALELAPDLPFALLNRAKLYESSGELEKAEADVNAFIQLAPDAGDGYHYRGNIRHWRGDYENAIADQTKAIELAPNEGIFYFYRAAARLSINDLEGARADWEESLRLGTGHAMSEAAIFHNLAGIKQRQGDFEGALAIYDKAISLLPTLVGNDANVAQMYINRGDLRQKRDDKLGAIADYDEAIRIAPKNVWAYVLRGTLYIALDNLEKALSDLSHAIGLDPGSFQAFNNRGWARQCNKDYDGALEDYNQAIFLNSELVIAYNNRAKLQMRKRDYAAAIEDCAAILRLESDNSFALHLHGYCNFQLGKMDESLADYERVVELAPDWYEGYIGRGYARAFKGDLESALADVEKARELKPDDAGVYGTRAYIRLQQQDFDAVIADCDEAIRLSRSYAEPYKYRAQAWTHKGEQAKADADLRQYQELIKPTWSSKTTKSWWQRLLG